MRHKTTLGLAAIIVAALCAGAAASVKISGLVFGLVFFLPLIWYRSWRLGTGKWFRQIALFGVVSIGTAFALNPSYWPNLARVDSDALAEELTHPDRPSYPQLYNLFRPLAIIDVHLRWRRLFGYYERDGDKLWRGNRRARARSIGWSSHPMMRVGRVVTRR